MFRRSIARSLIAIVPEKQTAIVTLLPDGPAPISINIFNAWLKPLDVNLRQYGGLNLQGDETRINIPQHELNPAVNQYEIRPRDRIAIEGTTYIVLSATRKSVLSRWECVVRKVIG